MTLTETKHDSLESWLANPAGIATLPVERLEQLHTLASGFNRSLDEAGGSPLHTVVSIKVPAQKALRMSTHIQSDAEAVLTSVSKLFAELAPLAPL